MQNICAAMRVKANEKNLELVLDIDSSLQHTHIISDPTRLAQIMYNLIGNAVKFTDKGSVTVKLTCANSSEYGVDVLFSVKDTGPGIPFGKHEAIFELFTQAASDTARRFGGTGLGLPIVKQVLGLFDSAIKLQSGPGEGTRFYFTISFGTATQVAQATSADAAPKVDMSHLKILVAEDIEINRMILKKQLSRLGLDAVIVEDGKQAYEAFLSGNYDILFIDLHMPVWGGYDAITHIRQLPDPIKANVPIVALTASITEDEKIMEAGFNSILYKPVQLNDVRTKLEEVMVGSTPLAAQQ
jgi:CheY-like chemotaxis protein